MKNTNDIFRKAISKDSEQLKKTDLQYLKDLEVKTLEYMKSRKVCGREPVMNYIKSRLLQAGNLVFITGGPSVGKSLIVSKVILDIDQSAKDVGSMRVDGGQVLESGSWEYSGFCS